MLSLFAAIVARDLRLAMRRRADALLPIVFFAVAASLVPLAVGSDPRMLGDVGPGLVWMCALLSALMSLTPMFSGDLADGSLEQMLLSGGGAIAVAAAKAVAHWLVTGLPLVVAAPLAGLMFGMSAQSTGVLAASLLLGTPVLSLLGAVAAALTLGLRSAGMLNLVLVLPLAVPALVFGAGAVTAAAAGQSALAHCALLGALLIVSALAAPPATAAALRIAVE